MIKRMLAKSGRKIRFWSQPATADILRERLNSGCQILHFTGHGDEHSLKVESKKHCGMAESLQVPYLSCLFSCKYNASFAICTRNYSILLAIPHRGYISSLRLAFYVQ